MKRTDMRLDLGSHAAGIELNPSIRAPGATGVAKSCAVLEALRETATRVYRRAEFGPALAQ